MVLRSPDAFNDAYESEVFVVHDDVLPVAMILGRNAIDALQLQLIQRNSDYG